MCKLFKGNSFEEYENFLLDYVLKDNPRIEDLYTKFDRKKIDIEAAGRYQSEADRVEGYGGVETLFALIDENGDGQLTGDEIDTDLAAGNWRAKQNSVVTPDVVKEYENGKLIREREGFDENENGWIDDENEQF